MPANAALLNLSLCLAGEGGSAGRVRRRVRLINAAAADAANTTCEA
eukprot:gene45084-16642_t